MQTNLNTFRESIIGFSKKMENKRKTKYF